MTAIDTEAAVPPADPPVAPPPTLRVTPLPAVPWWPAAVIGAVLWTFLAGLVGYALHPDVETVTANPDTGQVVAAPAYQPVSDMDRTARATVDAWLQPGTVDERRARLVGLTAPWVADQMADDMVEARVPNGRLVAGPSTIREVNGSGLYIVHLDTGASLQLILNRKADGVWEVTDFQT